jgi:hypothetical protein
MTIFLFLPKNKSIKYLKKRSGLRMRNIIEIIKIIINRVKIKEIIFESIVYKI